MKKKTLLLAALLGLGVLNAGAKDFYEFDNVTAETVLKLFLQAKEAGRNYPTLEEFQSIGVSAADIEFIRSHVRRSELVNPDDRLNPSLYKDRQVFMCTPMGNGSQGSHGYPGNTFGKTDVWTMWNYTASFGSWNHGFFQAPGSWADAAHKNGARLMTGQMFFEEAFGGASDAPWVNFIAQKDASGNYKYVEPMINALMYFGHDGIVYNWEASRYSNADVVAFHKALYKKAKERNFAGYGSLIYTLNSSLGAGNASAIYGTKEEPVHEAFMNYSGGSISSASEDSYKYAANTLGDASRLYAGVHIARINNRNWEELDYVKNINLICWGEHTSNQLYSHTKGDKDSEWQANYQKMQEHFFSGGNSNPANLPTGNADAATYDNNLETFPGLAKWMPERSTVSRAFLTNFNVGNGEYYYDKGVKTTVGGWYNMSTQDVVPTYRWLIYNAGTTTVNKTLTAAFTHEDAYMGGSCLKLKGVANGNGADVVLYKTGISATAKTKAKVVAKALSGSAELSLLVRAGNEWKTYAVNAVSTSWGEAELDLSGLAGKKIERIGFRVKGSADLLVGKLEVNDGETVQPAKIKEFVLAESVSETESDVTLKLYWTVDGKVDEYGRSFNDDNKIDHFEILMKQNGKEVEVGRTSQWATIVSHLPLSAGQSLEVGVRSVSTDLKTASDILWRTVKKGKPDEIIDPKDTTGQGPHYILNYNKKAPHEREDRYVMHVGLYEHNPATSQDQNLQQFPDNNLTARITKQFYLDKTDEVVFNVTAGAVYRPYLSYHGLWMSGYAFIDWNNDGKFSTDGLTFDTWSKPTRTDMCEVVSFSAHSTNENSWYNSNAKRFDKGTQFPKDDNIKNWMGYFKVPENLKPGLYRMRFKLDWNNLDAGGSDEIRKDGGDIVDVLVNVQAPDGKVKVGAKAQNGKVEVGAQQLTESMNYSAEANKELKVMMTPATDYSVGGIAIKYGYNLENEKGVDAVGNRQWWSEVIKTTDTEYTIPAKAMMGNVLLTPAFVLANGINTVQVTEAEAQANDIYNLNGQLVRRAGSKRQLPHGVYVMKGRKVVF